MIGTIVSALAPIALVTALGWFAGRWKVLPDNAAAVLAGFVVTFALPLSLFLAAVAAKPSEILNPPYLAALAAGLVGSYAIGLLLARFAFQRTLPEASVQAIAASFPNMAYCGPPVLIAAIGPSAVLAVVIGNLIVTLILIPLTLVLLGGSGGIARAIRSAVLQPLVLLPVFGAVLAVAGVRLPDLLTSSVDEIGRAAGGTALFTLGLILSRITPRIDRDVLVNVSLKNVVQPALILGTGMAVGLSGDQLAQVFLIGVLPAATAVPTLALAHQTYADEAAASVMASTLFAILSISGGIAIVGALS
ncbi:AEC family transporter [Salinicola socius]|uniref:Transporter n=1 Tax=Salinicola socius TaxID=404433 RepID=A0A1Q8SXR3_9GAMM|nr:AEC family transporter [Salinicola socius]OLO06226.1 transporter [Salinicola socius]